MNVAKAEQDAVTTAAGSHCLIVCGSHRNAYSGRLFLLHQLHKIICFLGETERYSPWGDEGVRGLCSPGAAVTPRWGSGACPPAHLGAHVVGLEAKGKTLRASERQITSQGATWPTLVPSCGSRPFQMGGPGCNFRIPKYINLQRPNFVFF